MRILIVSICPCSQFHLTNTTAHPQRTSKPKWETPLPGSPSCWPPVQPPPQQHPPRRRRPERSPRRARRAVHARKRSACVINGRQTKLAHVVYIIIANLTSVLFFSLSIVENGQENCAPLIEAHLKCMRDQGFNI